MSTTMHLVDNKWTFGIITNGRSPNFVQNIIDSIYTQNIPDDHYEIVVIGGDDPACRNTTHIAFDEGIRNAWITKKKNIIADVAKYSNLSIHHDYVALNPGWYDGWQQIGYNWDASMTRIINTDNKRFRDWVKWDCGQVTWVDYNDHTQTRLQYQSGTYLVIKRDFLRQHRFNEALCWGMSEDIEWAMRVRNQWRYRMNAMSSVRLLRYKDHWPIPVD